MIQLVSQPQKKYEIRYEWNTNYMYLNSSSIG